MKKCYRFEFRPYGHPFKRPMQTSQGTWDVREGIIVRLTDQKGKVGLGEIAPINWLGCETLQQALDFCIQLPLEITPKTIFSIPLNLPACQFGIESAWENLIAQPLEMSPIKESEIDYRKLSASEGGLRMGGGQHSLPVSDLAYSGLLPASQAALLARQILWIQGYRTFKWKIGVTSIEVELRIFRQLAKDIEASSQQQPAFLRLDANGGLNYHEAQQWLQACDRIGATIEFIEQPLPVDQFEAMLELSQQYSTPIALDESVATIPQMEAAYKNGWRGIFVIKPSIAGSPSELRQFCQSKQIDAVFSSVFETEIGRQAALRIASELHTQRAVGFGIKHWFKDENFNPVPDWTS